jgi:Zn-finger domain-containing protein
LIDQTLSLTRSENEQYLKLIEKHNDLKGVNMHESIEEWLNKKITQQAMKEAMKKADVTIRKVEQSIMESIEIGMEKRFGEKARNEVEFIQKLDNMDLLMNIQKALWTTNSFNEFVKIYRS